MGYSEAVPGLVNETPGSLGPVRSGVVGRALEKQGAEEKVWR